MEKNVFTAQRLNLRGNGITTNALRRVSLVKAVSCAHCDPLRNHRAAARCGCQSSKMIDCSFCGSFTANVVKMVAVVMVVVVVT
jgi:hypothetical protein